MACARRFRMMPVRRSEPPPLRLSEIRAFSVSTVTVIDRQMSAQLKRSEEQCHTQMSKLLLLLLTRRDPRAQTERSSDTHARLIVFGALSSLVSTHITSADAGIDSAGPATWSREWGLPQKLRARPPAWWTPLRRRWSDVRSCPASGSRRVAASSVAAASASAAAGYPSWPVDGRTGGAGRCARARSCMRRAEASFSPRSSRSSAGRRAGSPMEAARSAGVRPLMSFTPRSDPAPSKSRAACLHPKPDAQCKGVKPAMFRAAVLLPVWMSSCTAACAPAALAQWRGVWPANRDGACGR